MADHAGDQEKKESATESLIEKITEKFHGGDSSSSDSDDGKDIKSAARVTKSKMFLTRTEYDRGVNTFSPEGRLFQVKYAIEAIKLGSTAIGIKTKEGGVLAVEKRITSPLLLRPFGMSLLIAGHDENGPSLLQSVQFASFDLNACIYLLIQTKDGNEVFFRIKKSTQLKKLMNAYCDRQSLDFNSIALLFDGRRLRAEQTPDEATSRDDFHVLGVRYLFLGFCCVV
ncbi:hypothetical protein BUALT_Bualt12G0104600 [Buddleja alternifolia]|uniref:Ubiquitin-like domain-containing protein n=1 Tax=Buddleja alternifolia TaxID=168488 RepID=A0AAV6WY70_9LAMI|nr:hypothetical protein BUALT_Bualt12G0104600 [Buddleja alternifolia]